MTDHYNRREIDNHVIDVITSAVANPFNPEAEDESERWMAAQWELNRQVENVKWKQEIDDRELDAMALAAVVPVVLMEIDSRCAARVEAAELLDRLRNEWPRRRVTLRHCAARVDPPPPAILAGQVDRLQPFLCDLLEEERERVKQRRK